VICHSRHVNQLWLRFYVRSLASANRVQRGVHPFWFDP
jgi:hypothetical protein